MMGDFSLSYIHEILKLSMGLCSPVSIFDRWNFWCWCPRPHFLKAIGSHQLGDLLSKTKTGRRPGHDTIIYSVWWSALNIRYPLRTAPTVQTAAPRRLESQEQTKDPVRP